MTHSEWLTTTDVQRMLQHVEGKVSERKLRLLACAICELTYVPGNELPANGSTVQRNIDAARQAIENHDITHRLFDVNPTELVDGEVRAYKLFRGEPESSAIPAYIRCVVGDPFAPVTLPGPPCPDCEPESPDENCDDCGGSGDILGPCPWLTWNNGTIPAIAERIYRDRTWEDCPLLADALCDADCPPEHPIVRHLRGLEMCPRCKGNGRCGLLEEDACGGCGGAPLKDGPPWYRGTGWRRRDPLVWCRGAWSIDLLTGRT